MKVVSNAKCVYVIYLEDNSSVIFMPGMNYIDNEKVRDHPHFQGRVNSGIFTVEKDAPSKKNDKTKADLNEFERIDSKVLIKDISKMFDIALLERVAVTDSRPSVIKAATERLKEIDKLSKKADKKE